MSESYTDMVDATSVLNMEYLFVGMVFACPCVLIGFARCVLLETNPLPSRLLGVVLCQAGWYLVHFGNDKRFLKSWVREPLHKYSRRF